jgi:hypothetical protein
MKESHTQGLASQGNPESCAAIREDNGEALTGAHAGGVLSRENRFNRGADAVRLAGKQHASARQGKHTCDPARSKTSSMHGNSVRENREIPRSPAVDGPVGRAGKVDDHSSPYRDPAGRLVNSPPGILCAARLLENSSQHRVLCRQRLIAEDILVPSRVD